MQASPLDQLVARRRPMSLHGPQFTLTADRKAYSSARRWRALSLARARARMRNIMGDQSPLTIFCMAGSLLRRVRLICAARLAGKDRQFPLQLWTAVASLEAGGGAPMFFPPP